jgi:hypothetical protein
MNNVHFSRSKLTCCLTALLFFTALLAEAGAQTSTVQVLSLPNNNYRISTTNLGLEDLVFYRFSDGYEMTAMSSSASIDAPVIRQFKNGNTKVSAYIARKNGPIGIATTNTNNTVCNMCLPPASNLVLGEHIKLRNTSWSPFTEPAIPELLTDEQTQPTFCVTPNIPWFIIPLTIKAPQPFCYATVNIPDHMTVKGIFVKNLWYNTQPGSAFSFTDPDVSGILYNNSGVFRINLTSSFNTEFNVYLLVGTSTILGEISSFNAELHNPNGSSAGTSTTTTATRRFPHDPNELTPFQQYTCSMTHNNPPLRYRIDFQNLGAGVAQNVKVKAVVNNTVLDPYTVSNIAASHTLTSYESAPDNVLFTFNKIDLIGLDQNPAPPIGLTKGWLEFNLDTRRCFTQPYGNFFYTHGFVTFIGDNGNFSETIETNTGVQGINDMLCPPDPYCTGGKSPVTGTETPETDFATIKCYPSVFTDNINLEIPAMEESGDIQIILSDITGRTWRTLSYKIDAGTKYLETMAAPDVPTGMYLIHVRRGQHSATFKVIKN